MATYVLVPGADGRSWYWHRVAPLLQERGHEVIAVDLPVSDPAAGLAEHAAAVTAAMGPRRKDLVLVAQSLAGFIAPLVSERVPGSRLILVNAMVPRPGESAGEWWGDTGQPAARAEHYAREGL
ncbi:MAG: alpha/beta fold hydrolase, partial [Actinobacteria bacterium]|nr:alpha/beta fold hydrolase [Actinomycetota bacterium]